MTAPSQQPQIQITQTGDYREGYSNRVQTRVSVWDFLHLFGTMTQTAPEQEEKIPNTDADLHAVGVPC